MTGPADFAKMVPGFDFLQNLMQGAKAGLPQINQWIAPTLDPAELEKRIQDLKTVQFWLEQNTRLLGTTIQALEVQRMTLNTLKSMNLPLADLGAALRMTAPVVPAPAPAVAPVAAAVDAPAPVAAQAAQAAATTAEAAAEAAAAAAAPAVDPMQWWGALTQQFSEIAAQALKNSPVDSLRQAVGQAAAGTPARATKPARKATVKASAKPAAKNTRKTTRKTTPKAAAKRSRG